MERPVMMKLLSLKKRTAALIIFVVFLITFFGFPFPRNLDILTISTINSFIFAAVGAFIAYVFWSIVKGGRLGASKETPYSGVAKSIKTSRRKTKKRKE